MLKMSNTILIVEDNALNMKLFNDILQKNGYEVVQSDGIDDTVPLARKHRPGLIVMDIQLPGPSGLERTQKLKAEDDLKMIPVLAVTAFPLKGGIEKILESGCDDVLGKPISVPTFLETVARYF
jgi:two-component system cell cycle response regulator DivK